MAALTAYQNLDALTFNVLNQTKTLSAALCCYIVMGRKQSRMQVFALFLLLLSALIMEGIVSVDDLVVRIRGGYVPASSTSSAKWGARHFTHGVAPILLASFISGLAGALSQKNLQSSNGRNPYLFSMELCAGSILLLGASLMLSGDGAQIAKHGLWHGWTFYTFIPIVSNSCGGIVVGLVTKFAGSVRKGFALIFGILLSGIIQAIVLQETISSQHLLGGLVAAISLYLHATSPPAVQKKKKKKQE